MGRPVLAFFAAICLIACNGVIAADDRGLGLGDWNLGYVDAGSYYGSSSGSSPSVDASVPPPPDAGLCSVSGYSWILTPSASDCHFEVPTGGPDPLRIDPTAMYLDIWSSASPDEDAEYRPTLADCDSHGGWTWGLDDATAGPTRIALCPETCASFHDPTLTTRFTTRTQCERP